MQAGTTIFAQRMNLLLRRRFQTCVTRYHGDYKVRAFKRAEHFRVTAFAQLTYRESLRDIETSYNATFVFRLQPPVESLSADSAPFEPEEIARAMPEDRDAYVVNVLPYIYGGHPLHLSHPLLLAND